MFQGLIKTFLISMSEENRKVILAWYAREVFGLGHIPRESSGGPAEISSGHNAIEALLASMAAVTLAPPAPVPEIPLAPQEPQPITDTATSAPSVPEPSTSRHSIPRPRPVRRAPSVSTNAIADTAHEADSAAAPRATRSRTNTRPSRGATRGH